MTSTITENEYGFIFKEDGSVVILTGETSDPEKKEGDTATRIRQMCFEAMVSGDERRMLSAEVGATTLSMLTDQTIRHHVIASLGALADDGVRITHDQTPSRLN